MLVLDEPLDNADQRYIVRLEALLDDARQENLRLQGLLYGERVEEEQDQQESRKPLRGISTPSSRKAELERLSRQRLAESKRLANG